MFEGQSLAEMLVGSVVTFLCIAGIVAIVNKFAGWMASLEIEAERHNKRIELGIWRVAMAALAVSCISLVLSIVALLR